MASPIDTPADEYPLPSPTLFRRDQPPELTPQRPLPSLSPKRTRRHPTSLPEEFLSELVQLRRRVNHNFTNTLRQHPQQQPHQHSVRSSPHFGTRTESAPQRQSSSFMNLPSTPHSVNRASREQAHYPSQVNESPSNKRYPVNNSGAMPKRCSTSFTNLPRTTHTGNQSPMIHPSSSSSHQPRRPSAPTSYQQSQHLKLMPSHQVKSIPTFTGNEKNTSIDDWVRDAKYLIDTTAISKELQFSTIVRYLGGAARKLVLNLPRELQNPKEAFAELKAQFGDMLSGGDPLAEFYERVRRLNESPSIYAVELEATLRTTEERMNRSIPPSSRNRMLTQQFMRGVKDDKITQRLAPMKPRDMPFRELQAELRLIERENRMDAALHQRPTKVQVQLQSTKSQTLPCQPVSSSEPKAPVLLREQSVETHQRPEYDPELMQDVIIQMQHLAKQVDSLSRRSRTTQPATTNQPTQNRVFICYKCGNEGHIARGCRSAPLNSQGPRSQGKPSEARNQ